MFSPDKNIILRREDALTSKKFRALEEKAKKLGLSEKLLIENASSNLAHIIHNLNLGRKVICIGAKGNNAADTFACARKLANFGYKVKVAVLRNKALGEEANFQLKILKKMALPIFIIRENNVQQLSSLIKKNDFIVDGILGMGIKGEVRGLYKEAIEIINKSKKTVISCDIPSGILPDRPLPGRAVAIKADYTITFIALKKSFLLDEVKKYCGKILIADIGLARKYLN